MNETFTKVGRFDAMAESGYIVRYKPDGRMGAVIYEFGGRTMEFYSEIGVQTYLVELDPFQWNSPHEQQQLSDSEKREIIARVGAALRFLKIPYTLRGKEYDTVMGPGMEQEYPPPK